MPKFLKEYVWLLIPITIILLYVFAFLINDAADESAITEPTAQPADLYCGPGGTSC
jgi:hypothetical protein